MEDIFEELAAVGSDDEVRIEENDQGGSGNRDDEAEEANDTRRVVKPPKRVISRPRPKLDPARLLGPRGMFVVKSTFEGVKFKGKGHELDDLNNVLSRLQHWAHRLFPKMTFDDCIEKIEELGNKKEIQTNMHKIRNGMIDLDSIQQSVDIDEPDIDRVASPPPNDDVFDQLVAAAPAAPQTTLTDEQRARMMRNRLLAEERRMARRLAREKELEEQNRVVNSSAADALADGTGNVVDTSNVESNDVIIIITEGVSSEEPAAVESSTENVKSKDNTPSCVFDDSPPITTQDGMKQTTSVCTNYGNDTTRLLSDSPCQLSDGSAPQETLQKSAAEDVSTVASSSPDISNRPSCESTEPTESTDLQLNISESDLMDVDCPSVPSGANFTEASATSSQIDTSKRPLVDDVMDVGSAEDWEAAFAEEERALAGHQS